METSRAVRAGKISPVELTEDCLARIARLNLRVNAFITITENGNIMSSRKFDAQAVTQDGQRLNSFLFTENYVGDGNGPRVEKFEFQTPLANVAKFVVGTRPIRTTEWDDVKLPRENFNQTAQSASTNQ